MSNSLAMAAVTTTLRALLIQEILADPDLVDASVTTLPPDKARGTNNSNQVNLFLYQTAPNAAWRNMDAPRQVKAGETGVPPLALNLYYLITAYGRDDDDIFSHRLLARAMAVLHDHPLLSPEEIKTATSIVLPANDLSSQLERVRFTLQPLSVEEIFRLWSGFQTQYRLSAAYEASVILLDSSRPLRTPLPVLARGRDDRGVLAQSNLIPPFPALDALLPANRQSSARLGETLTLSGHHLAGDSVTVNFMTAALPAPISVGPQPGATDTLLTVQLPNDPLNWVAGFYAVNVTVGQSGQTERVTNQLSLTLAPRLLSVTPSPASRDAAGNLTLTVTCSPEVRPEQRVSLLPGDTEVLAQPHPLQTATLTFNLIGVSAGDYWLRLRVDGVDSLLVNRTVTPPVFDQSQKVTIV